MTHRRRWIRMSWHAPKMYSAYLSLSISCFERVVSGSLDTAVNHVIAQAYLPGSAFFYPDHTTFKYWSGCLTLAVARTLGCVRRASLLVVCSSEPCFDQEGIIGAGGYHQWTPVTVTDILPRYILSRTTFLRAQHRRISVHT